MHSTVAVTAPLQLARPQSRAYLAAWAALCAALVGVIAVADYLTGYELNLSILYLATVCLATWKLGRAGGIFFSLTAVAAWLVAETLAGHAYSHLFYRYWEMTIRMVTWLGFALILDKLKTALARADERFVTVLERLDAAVYVADGATGELLYRNERCGQAFGPNLARVQEIERRLASPGSPQPLPRPSAAGTQTEVEDAATGRWYLLAARAIRWMDGRPVGLYIATDVTERRRTDELGRQQQARLEMTSRLTTLGEMASTLAHEINQPLTAIANYCRGCVRRLRSGEWKSEDLLEALEKAAAQAERAGRIIQRVREFPRKRDPDPRPCDINAIVSAVAQMVSVETERRGARLRLELARDLPAVLADQIMIEQVMMNLIKNGIDAMQQVPAQAREIAIRSAADSAGRVAIEIADRGVGLPPQLRETLFVPYFTTKPDGMGMGLQICRSIIERHGGRLTAAPGPEGGSIFRFSLPAVQS